MEEKPLVSVVIPVYNGSNYMREAIDSALAQTYPNIEIIVVNDGSTDNTREIALSYGDKIRYFEKENGGVSTALNLGIKKMRGEFFSWLSHDDVYYPDKVQAEIDALRKNGNMNQAVYSGWDALVMPERRIEPHVSPMSRKCLETGLLAPIFGFISGCSLLIPKCYFNQYGLFDELLRGVQDYTKWFQMFRDKRLLYVDKSLIQSRVHECQVTHTYGKMHQEEEALYRWMLESVLKEEIVETGIEPYLFWGAALTRMKSNGFQEAYDVALQRLRELDEPPDGMERRKKFRMYLESISDKGIFLYCAGVRGRRLAWQLKMLGVDVKGFSDSDNKKWGKEIEGVMCIPPIDIPPKSCVIVTKENSEKLCRKLMKSNSYSVISYEKIEMDLMNIPLRKAHLEI